MNDLYAALALGDRQSPLGLARILSRAREQVVTKGRVACVALSLAAHGLMVLAILSMRSPPPKPAAPLPMTVALIQGLRPAPEALALPSPKTSPTKPVPQKSLVKPRPAPPDVDTIDADKSPDADTDPGLSDAELAGAATAESGSPGGVCNMVRWLQSALRKDPLVQAAVSGSAGKAMRVWNGEWIRSQGEDGNGMAAVREAIMWEVAFAPAACRAQPVHGLVLISMNESGRSARLALGSGDDWRWTDMLTPHGGVTGHTVERP